MATRFPVGPQIGRLSDEVADQSERRLVLASGSPRRRELLGRLGIDFDVRAPDIDESPGPDERPVELVSRLAAAKASAIAHAHPGAVVLGADTVVDVDGEILGKPTDVDDARRMLHLVSGRRHWVHTAVSARRCRIGHHDGRPNEGSADQSDGRTATEVTFVTLSDAMIDWYLATGEPADKAGAYGLQGVGGLFVERVDGCVSGVLGLPMTVVVRLLVDLGVVVLSR
jgi:nucleoside triphosphate pyrophosphatase